MGFQLIQHYAKIMYLAEIFISLYENALRKAFEAQLIQWKFVYKVCMYFKCASSHRPWGDVLLPSSKPVASFWCSVVLLFLF